VSADQVDDYLRGVEEPKRSTLQALRRTILELVPEAEQLISYRVPAFRVRGQTVAGFAAFKDHLSYLPFSGSVLGQLADELDGYTMSKSALHFPIDRPPTQDACGEADRGAARGGRPKVALSVQRLVTGAARAAPATGHIQTTGAVSAPVRCGDRVAHRERTCGQYLDEVIG
jgi:uncharacterized protein YdhG (YjbR/CyaY superfamily)